MENTPTASGVAAPLAETASSARSRARRNIGGDRCRRAVAVAVKKQVCRTTGFCGSSGYPSAPPGHKLKNHGPAALNGGKAETSQTDPGTPAVDRVEPAATGGVKTAARN